MPSPSCLPTGVYAISNAGDKELRGVVRAVLQDSREDGQVLVGNAQLDPDQDLGEEVQLGPVPSPLSTNPNARILSVDYYSLRGLIVHNPKPTPSQLSILQSFYRWQRPN